MLFHQRAAADRVLQCGAFAGKRRQRVLISICGICFRSVRRPAAVLEPRLQQNSGACSRSSRNSGPNRISRRVKAAPRIGEAGVFGRGVWTDIWLTIPQYRQILQTAAAKARRTWPTPSSSSTTTRISATSSASRSRRPAWRFPLRRTARRRWPGSTATSTTSSCSTSACLKWTGWKSAARSGKPRTRRSCSCRPATRRSTASSASKSAATTM